MPKFPWVHIPPVESLVLIDLADRWGLEFDEAVARCIREAARREIILEECEDERLPSGDPE